MENQTCIISCANLSREVRAVYSRPEFREYDHKTCPVECDQSEGQWKGLKEMISGCLTNHRSVLVIGGYCLVEEEKRLEPDSMVRMARQSQCFEWLVDPYIADLFQRQKKFFLLPGWVENWEGYVESRWQGDRKKTRAHFAGLGKTAVLLDTGLYPEVREKMNSFSKYLRIPYEVFPVGLSLFRLNLGLEFTSLKMKKDRDEYESVIALMKQRAIRMSGIENLLQTNLRDGEEKSFSSRVLDIFKEVMNPLEVSFFPLEILKQTKIAAGSPLEKLVSQGVDYAWDEDSGGLLLNLSGGQAEEGIIEISKVPAGQKEEVLSLSLALVKAAGSAAARNRLLADLEEERKKTDEAREALRNSEDWRNSVSEGVPIGIYRTTPDGRIIHVNMAFVRMVGFDNAESVKKLNSRDFYADPSVRDTTISLMETQGFITDFEAQMKRRDGEIIWVKDTASAFKDSSGKIIFYDGAIEDITRKKQADVFMTLTRELQSAKTELSDKILKHFPIDEISSVVLANSMKLTASPLALVGYVEKSSGRFVISAATPDLEAFREAYKDMCPDFHGHSRMFEEARASRKPLIINAPQIYGELAVRPDLHPEVDKLMIVPAVVEDSLVGMIIVANSDRLYSDLDLSAVKELAGFYAMAIDRYRQDEELRELSLVDELTKLYNRRGFLTLAQQQIKMANRQKREIILLYVDMDDLKMINDKYGHHEGDLALVETASILRSAFRESDIIARIGGDEFIVLALDAAENQEDVLYERVKQKESESNSRPGCKFPIFLSLGLARYLPDKPHSIDDLINTADGIMYQNKMAKKAGNGRDGKE